MKKLIFMSLFLCGCLPQQKITGRVIDQSGPVPGAALLGMVWVEDAAKAKAAPDTNGLAQEARDVALERDMKDRGLPVAYARTFADGKGWFTLDKLHFSAENKKAVAAMKEPRITRVTLLGFQRGYSKQALTMFPKQKEEEMAPATLLLTKPGNWKDLYVENTVDSLTKDYMAKGYSKEFGATEHEKSWILEYTHSNLWKAYVESDIKGDKELAELCGHDYSNVQVSAAGIERKSAQERCAELKQRMGAIREIEDLWISHASKSGDPLSAAKELVRRAIALLPAEITEPKEYESMILAGLEDAANAQAKTGFRNGLNDQAWQDAAIAKYASGDKAAAYRVLGYDLYWQISKDLTPGTLTAQVSLNTIPGIKEKTAGFYLLMNRPLTAQLPGSDTMSERVGAKKEAPKPTKINLGGDELELLDPKGGGSYQLPEKEVVEIGSDGEKYKYKVSKRVRFSRDGKYAVKVETKNTAAMEEHAGNKLTYYDIAGNVIFEKDFGLLNGVPQPITDTRVLDNGKHVLVEIHNGIGENYDQLELYNSQGEVVLSTPIGNQITYRSEYYVPPSGSYVLLFRANSPGGPGELYKYNFKEMMKISEGKGFNFDCFVGEGENYVASWITRSDKKAASGDNYLNARLSYFSDERELWSAKLTYEGRGNVFFSKNSRYLINLNDTERKLQGNRIVSYREFYSIYETSSGKLVAEGKLSPEIVEKYKNETINASDAP